MNYKISHSLNMLWILLLLPVLLISDKIQICHQRGNDEHPLTPILIEISTSALPAHIAHGDVFPYMFYLSDEIGCAIVDEECPSCTDDAPTDCTSLCPTGTECVDDGTGNGVCEIPCGVFGDTCLLSSPHCCMSLACIDGGSPGNGVCMLPCIDESTPCDLIPSDSSLACCAGTECVDNGTGTGYCSVPCGVLNSGCSSDSDCCQNNNGDVTCEGVCCILTGRPISGNVGNCCSGDSDQGLCYDN